MGGVKDMSIDLSDLDTADVSWLGDDDAVGLYSLAPGAGIAITENPGNGKGCCSSGGCVCGRPISWCCINCH